MRLKSLICLYSYSKHRVTCIVTWCVRFTGLVPKDLDVQGKPPSSIHFVSLKLAMMQKNYCLATSHRRITHVKVFLQLGLESESACSYP